MSAKQWAQLLGVRLPSTDPNVMDTCANRSHSTTTEEDPEMLCKEGHCYNCKKQGHLAWNCLAKPKTFDEGKAKACTAKAKASSEGSNSDSLDDEEHFKAFVKKERAMKKR
jgi:hypothetical protein